MAPAPVAAPHGQDGCSLVSPSRPPDATNSSTHATSGKPSQASPLYLYRMGLVASPKWMWLSTKHVPGRSFFLSGRGSPPGASAARAVGTTARQDRVTRRTSSHK